MPQQTNEQVLPCPQKCYRSKWKHKGKQEKQQKQKTELTGNKLMADIL